MLYNDVNSISELKNSVSWNDIKDDIHLRLVNSKILGDYGEDIVARKFNDLSVCLSLQKKTNDTVQSYILKEHDIKELGINTDDMFMQGMYNMSHDGEVRIMTLKEFLMRGYQMDALAKVSKMPIPVSNTPMSQLGLIYDIEEDGTENILCICSRKEVFGASYIICPDVLKEVYARFHENFYVFFISVHEAMCVRHGYVTNDCGRTDTMAEMDLAGMVERINDQPDKEWKDILSYKLYYYYGDDGERMIPVR